MPMDGWYEAVMAGGAGMAALSRGNTPALTATAAATIPWSNRPASAMLLPHTCPTAMSRSGMVAPVVLALRECPAARLGFALCFSYRRSQADHYHQH